VSGYGSLFPQHAQMLAASGITPEHAHARRYMSVDTKARLEQIGVTSAGRRVPGLLIPQLRLDGSVWGYQYRPDSPRERDGKPVKYETPTGQRNGIDVPPGVAGMLADPGVPLWVTEGVKKADAASLAGLACVALPGVWSWRGGNDKGGKTAVPDWHDIALNGRRVVLAFDSDVTRKPAVSKALRALADYLASKAAAVEYAHLPDGDPGKTGLDDFLAAGHTAEDLRALVRPEPPAVVTDARVTEPGKVTADKPLSSGVTPVTLVTPPSEGAGIDGVRLLDELVATACRFVAFPSPAAAVAVALWVVHTHCLDAFDSSPRLAALSPEPQSGKTRLMELLEHLADRPMFTTNTTVAVLARGLDAGTFATILLDEADTVFGSKAKGDEDLRGLLNSGHRRGATYMRMVGEGTKMDAKSFSTFSAVALAGLGDLPETVMQRAVILRMRRRAPHEQVEAFRRRQHAPLLDQLRTRASAWAQFHARGIAERWPEMPEGVTDRPADVWEPLLAIADEAGGHWPATARAACVELLHSAQTVDSGSLGVRLLADLRAVWKAAGEPDGMHTDTILEALLALEEAPWSDLRGKPLDARSLGRRLRQYGIASRPVRTGVDVRKGYRREDLHDAWTRYLPPSPKEGLQGLQGSHRAGKPVTPAEPVTLTKVTSAAPEQVSGFRTPASPEQPERHCCLCRGPIAGAHLEAGRAICEDCERERVSA
jgi:hypothetical protein